MNIELFVGIVGMALLLVAFVLNQAGRWHRGSLHYDATNLAGAILLVIYAVSLAAWPFVILNTIWLLYSAKDVIQSLQRKG